MFLVAVVVVVVGVCVMERVFVGYMVLMSLYFQLVGETNAVDRHYFVWKLLSSNHIIIITMKYFFSYMLMLC